MRLEQRLADFAARHRLSPLDRDERGAYAVTLDATLRLMIEERGPKAALITATVGPVPEPTPAGEAALMRLMRLHFARMREHREILAVDPEDAALIQLMPVPLDRLSGEMFDATLAVFANALEFWRHQLTSGAGPRVRPMGMTMLFP